MSRRYYVYILANYTRTIYVGITNDIHRRMHEHQLGNGNTFVTLNRLRRLVYVETCDLPLDAIRREKQIKGWVRRRKVALIETMNPDWADLAEEWGWKDTFLRSPRDSSDR